MKPQDFLIGIREFFGVLVPGVIILWLVPPETGASLRIGSETAALFVFAIVAYLLGALADKLGSVLDYLIDPLLKPDRYPLSATRLKAFAVMAERCRDLLLWAPGSPVRPDEHPTSIKAFWWNHLRLHCPAAKQELDRIEADQKLFRSLTSVFLFLAIYGAAADPAWRPWPAEVFPHFVLGSAVLSVISAALYAYGRVKFLSAAYRLALAYCIPACVAAGRGEASPDRT